MMVSILGWGFGWTISKAHISRFSLKLLFLHIILYYYCFVITSFLYELLYMIKLPSQNGTVSWLQFIKLSSLIEILKENIHFIFVCVVG